MDTAFIGLDYIVDITHPSGLMARSAEQVIARRVIAHANHALRLAVKLGWLRILVKTGFADGYQDLPRSSPLLGRAHLDGALLLSGHGTDFHPDLEHRLADLVVVKPRIGAFHASGLDAALRVNGITRVVLAGVSTTWAVHGAAREAHDRDYTVVVAEDACADAGAEEHAAAIRQLGAIARVVGTAELDAR